MLQYSFELSRHARGVEFWLTTMLAGVANLRAWLNKAHQLALKIHQQVAQKSSPKPEFTIVIIPAKEQQQASSVALKDRDNSEGNHKLLLRSEGSSSSDVKTTGNNDPLSDLEASSPNQDLRMEQQGKPPTNESLSTAVEQDMGRRMPHNLPPHMSLVKLERKQYFRIDTANLDVSGVHVEKICQEILTF